MANMGEQCTGGGIQISERKPCAAGVSSSAIGSGFGSGVGGVPGRQEEAAHGLPDDPVSLRASLARCWRRSRLMPVQRSHHAVSPMISYSNATPSVEPRVKVSGLTFGEDRTS